MNLLLNEKTQTASAPHVAANPQHMVRFGESFVPQSPTRLDDVGIDAVVVAGLALKHAYSAPKFSTEWMISRLCLPLPVVSEILDSLRDDHLIEVVGPSGPFGFNYAATNRGREHANRLMDISGYVGPTPVSLEAYISALEFQFNHLPTVCPDDVESSVEQMVLSKHIQQVGGLAIMSRRSLFLHGPPGNGKTTLGHLLHNSVRGDIWIPYSIGIENEVIRVFDPECHERSTSETSNEALMQPDSRWVKIKRPFIVVGGELTMEALDLIHEPGHGYYEAPLHFKANGGTFLLDDFGCQRVPPQELLNRWIHPLERGIDFLTLKTGRQLEVPFRQMLIVSTNLDPDTMMTPAFLRRLGYRIFMPNPSADIYSQIFHRYAAQSGVEVSAELLGSLLMRYEAEQRPLKSCEPRDLIERAKDICRYRGTELTLSDDILDMAWRGYFGYDESVTPTSKRNRHNE